MLPSEIVAGARTVLNVALHFTDLRESVDHLLATLHGSQRGFFTPSEDEQIRQTLVSYWQARNALIELVTSCHRDLNSTLPTELRPAAFLVAYSGALVLIDAARFMRGRVHDRPIVREKLNEPEPHFGIPAGTYDRVQRSLTSPVHVWHVYHASRYYNENRQRLVRLAQRRVVLSPLIDVIDELSSAIDVSAARVSAARIRSQAHAVRSMQRDLLSRAMYGLQKAVSRLLSETSLSREHRPFLPAAVARRIRQLLRPGDVLITRKEFALTNYFLPGFWPHAALYIGSPQELLRAGVADHEHVRPRWQRLVACGPGDPQRVLEALKDGVWIRPLSCPLACDAIVVVRPRLDVAEISYALTRGLFHDGKPYDFDFDFTRSDRLVCTEVVYRSFEGVGGIRFELSRRAGRMTLAAEDLLRMAGHGEHFQTVAAFAPPHSADLAIGLDAGSIIEHTLENH